MIERVAEVIGPKLYGMDCVSEQPIGDWKEVDRKHARSIAVDILRAMREPTIAMMFGIRDWRDDVSYEETWRAMIDKALEVEKKSDELNKLIKAHSAAFSGSYDAAAERNILGARNQIAAWAIENARLVMAALDAASDRPGTNRQPAS